MIKTAYACLALLPSMLAAQGQRPDSLVVTVTAVQSARIPANRLTMYVTVEGTAETGADAQARLNQKLSAVSAALLRVSAIQADKPVSYGVFPAAVQSYPPPAAPTYVARSLIRVVVTRLDQVAEIQSTLMAAGAAGTTGHTFESTSTDSARRALLADALRVAKADAQAIAAAQGVTLGSIAEISSNAFPTFQQPGYITFDQRSSPPSPAPDVPVTAQVMVRYRIAR